MKTQLEKKIYWCCLLYFCCRLWTLFKITFFFQKILSGTLWAYLNGWRFKSRSELMLCLSWSGSKLFAKVISSQQKSLLARKEITVSQKWRLSWNFFGFNIRLILTCVPDQTAPNVAVWSGCTLLAIGDCFNKTEDEKTDSFSCEWQWKCLIIYKFHLLLTFANSFDPEIWIQTV